MTTVACHGGHRRAGSGGCSVLNPTAKTTIILIESRGGSTYDFAPALTHAGYRVVTACGGDEALACVTARDDVDVALIDIDLHPGIGAADTARRLLSLRDIPVLFLFNGGDERTLDRVRDVAHYGLVPRGIDALLLRSAIDTAVDLSENLRMWRTSGEMLAGHCRRLEETIEYANDGVMTFNTARVVTACNQSAAMLLGHPRERLIGQNLRMLYRTQEEYEAAGNRARMAFNSTGVFTGEIDIMRPDGAVRRLEISLRLLPGADSIVGIFRDITERTRTAEALRDSEARLQLALEASGIALFDWDLEHDRWIVSPNYYTALGYEAREGPADRAAWLERCHPDDREAVVRLIGRVLDGTEEHYEYEARIRHADGSYRWNHTIGHVVARNDRGMPTRMIGVRIDIDERKTAGEKVKALLAEKEMILREVHHRVKNNMNTMRAILEMQGMTMKEPAAVEAVTRAAVRMRSMAILYERLFDSAIVSEMSIAAYLPDLVDDIVMIFPNSRNVQVEKRIEDFTLSVKALSSVGIIVNELITNAMKHAFVGRDRGQLTVTAVLADDGVTLTVADDGVGVPAGLDGSNTAGLGLKMVEMLTTQMEGVLRIERERGTRYILTFKPQ